MMQDMTVSHSSSVTLNDVQTQSPMKWWEKREWSMLEMPLLFVASLFDPFIEDAPKVLGWVKGQGEKLDKMGTEGYLIDTGKNVATSIIRTAKADPVEFALNVITQGGAFALGSSGEDASYLLPIIVGTATGIKQSQMFFAAAKALESKTTVDKIIKVGMITAGVYMVASVPCAAALDTITFGTQYQVSTNTPGSYAISSTSTPGTAFGLWLDPTGNVVGCTLNSTGHGSIFTLSASTNSATPYLTCSTTNQLCIASWACGTDICVRPFNPFTQALSAITNANTVASTNIGDGASALLQDGNIGVTWSASNPGIFEIWARIYSSITGAALTNPLNINIDQATLQGSSRIVGLPTNPARALIAWSGGSGSNNNIYSAVVNTATGTTQSTAQIISTNSTVQGNINCFTANGEGRIAWVRGQQAIIQRIATSGDLIGNSYILQGAVGTPQSPYGLGTPDNNYFISFGQFKNGFPSAYGATYESDSTGTLRSAVVQIPFNPNDNSQGPAESVQIGGTATNYDLLAFYSGEQIAGVSKMYARSINVQTDTTTPTPTPSSTTPTPTPSSTTPTPTPSSTTPTPTPSSMTPTPSSTTPTPTPTTAPTSDAGSLQPGMLQLPFQMVYFGMKGIFQAASWLIGK